MDALMRELLTRPAAILIVLSAAGFTILASNLPDVPSFSFCGSLSSVTLAYLPLMLPERETLIVLAGTWLSMITAMMPLLLVKQLRHVMQSSVATRRNIAAFLFLGGYGLVWMVAGLAVIPLAAIFHVFTFPALTLLFIVIAFAWSTSPVGGRAHNACHRLYPVTASGPTANWDCLSHGSRTGATCSVACWPWMLAPFGFSATWHLPAMAAISLFLFIERIGPPQRPAWRVPYAFRLVFPGRPRRLLGRPLTR